MLRRLTMLAALVGVAAVPAPASAGILSGTGLLSESSGQVKIISAWITSDFGGGQSVNVNGSMYCGGPGVVLLSGSLTGTKTVAMTAPTGTAYQCRYRGDTFHWVLSAQGLGFRGGDRVLAEVTATGAVNDTDKKYLTMGWQH